MQLWYLDDAGVGGTFEALRKNMRYLLVRGPPQGYLPDLTMSILVVSPHNVQQSEEQFHGMGVQVVTVSLYLGGFIGDQESKKAWLAEKVMGWTDSVEVLTKVARRHTQTDYAGLENSLQKEWDFVQRITPHIGAAF